MRVLGADGFDSGWYGAETAQLDGVEVVDLGGGEWQYEGELVFLSGNDLDGFHEQTVEWNCKVKNSHDGGVAGGGATFFVDADVNFLNGDPNNTQPFSILMSVVIDAPGALPTTQQTGSAAGSVTDFGGNGAALSAQTGDSIYTALVDNTTVQKRLFEDGSPGSSIGAGPGGSAVLDSDSFGNFSQAGPGIGIGQTINLRLAVDLDSLSIASLSGVFAVEAVPSPAGLAVLGLGGLFGRRRRRSC